MSNTHIAIWMRGSSVSCSVVSDSQSRRWTQRNRDPVDVSRWALHKLLNTLAIRSTGSFSDSSRRKGEVEEAADDEMCTWSMKLASKPWKSDRWSGTSISLTCNDRALRLANYKVSRQQSFERCLAIVNAAIWYAALPRIVVRLETWGTIGRPELKTLFPKNPISRSPLLLPRSHRLVFCSNN